MKYELTFEQLKEIILCAARNCLNDDEAIEYLQDIVGEMMDTKEWPDESRIEVIGQNGNNGEHYK